MANDNENPEKINPFTLSEFLKKYPPISYSHEQPIEEIAEVSEKINSSALQEVSGWDLSNIREIARKSGSLKLDESKGRVPSMSLLYFEPKSKFSFEPVIDGLTRKMTDFLNKAEAGSGYRGVHECACGAISSNCDYFLNVGGVNFVTNSLAPHYLAFHRKDISKKDLLSLEELFDLLKLQEADVEGVNLQSPFEMRMQKALSILKRSKDDPGSIFRNPEELVQFSLASIPSLDELRPFKRMKRTSCGIIKDLLQEIEAEPNLIGTTHSELSKLEKEGKVAFSREEASKILRELIENPRSFQIQQDAFLAAYLKEVNTTIEALGFDVSVLRSLLRKREVSEIIDEWKKVREPGWAFLLASIEDKMKGWEITFGEVGIDQAEFQRLKEEHDTAKKRQEK